MEEKRTKDTYDMAKEAYDNLDKEAHDNMERPEESQAFYAAAIKQVECLTSEEIKNQGDKVEKIYFELERVYNSDFLYRYDERRFLIVTI